MIELSSNIYNHLKQGNVFASDCAVLGIKILYGGSGTVTPVTLFTSQQSLSAN